MTDNWWDDLPDGSVLMHPDTQILLLKTDGEYIADDGLPYPTQYLPEYTVIYVPVTDTEPPPGSIVSTKGKADHPYWHVYGEWCPVGCSAPRLKWDEVRPHVTRILRWGE